MPRRVQDIVPGDRRSIRNIPVEKERLSPKVKPKEKVVEEDDVEVTDIAIHKLKSDISIPPPIKKMPMTPPTPIVEVRLNPLKKYRWAFLIVGIVIAILVSGYIASTYFSRASFTIVPKSVSASINGTYVAKLAPSATGDLTYEVVTLKSTASTSVVATDGPKISTIAKGRVTLYNAYSASSVRLIAGTRLSSDDGFVYKLSSSVVIPGYTKPGATIIPGKVSVDVVADQPGAQYNASASNTGDLKVVAYKGGPRYETIYARIIADIKGGFVGIKKNVSSSVVGSTTASLKKELTQSLLQKVKSSIPDGYVMFDNNYASSFGTVNIGDAGTGSAIISLSGTVHAFIFKKSDLIKKLVGEESVASFGNFSYNTTGLDEIVITVANLKDFSPDKKLALVLNAKGNIRMTGAVPVEEIKQKLAGMSLSDTQTIFKTYGPVIASGSGELIPPWTKIPSDLDRIKITIDTK